MGEGGGQMGVVAVVISRNGDPIIKTGGTSALSFHGFNTHPHSYKLIHSPGQ